jgi:hypothetical protein
LIHEERANLIFTYCTEIQKYGEITQHYCEDINTECDRGDLRLSYELDGRDSILDRAREFLSSPERPDRLWDAPSLLSNECQRLFPLE